MWMLGFIRIENDMLHPHTFQYKTRKSPSLSYQKLPQLLRKNIFIYCIKYYFMILKNFELLAYT